MTDFTAVARSLEERGYTVKAFSDGKAAAAYLDRVIDGTVVGIGGSVTVRELGLYERLAKHNTVRWHWIDGMDTLSAASDSRVYLASANALAETGEIVNIDVFGNRIANLLYGHEKVYLVIGRNKLTPTCEEAVWRARNVAAPQNAARKASKTPCALDGRCHDCRSPERICRAMTVQWGPMLGMETEIILIDEDLGY